MSWLGRFTRQLGLGGNAANSRGIARERLSIILAHQRGEILLEGIDMKRLQGEVLECVKKYIAVDDSKPMHLSVRQDGAVDLFEIQVHLAGSSTPATRHGVKPGGKQLA